jgi:LuxR family maltose regulon positive regulatory protein
MPAPFMATKLYIPPPGRYLVDRPRLLEKLDECLRSGCRLALVCAPAGFGKTTLVGAWITNLKSSTQPPSPRAAWLSLDERDNDPVLFWSYIIAALQTQQEGLGKQSLSLLQTAHSPDLEGNLAALVNDLAGIPEAFILVLDDYHIIRNLAIHRSLSFFIEHAPAQFHLILASRTDPPLPLALMRGRGQLLDIRLNDLRFSNEDANAFLNLGMGLNLEDRAVHALNGKAEGWAAGLQMAALSLQEAAVSQDRQRVEDFIASFSGSNRYILDYLIEEILNQQPAEIQNFLLKTSILDRLCGPLCDALLAAEGGVSPASQKVLEDLESRNLFILPLDEQRYWYRYHKLFTDLLRKRLGQMDPGIIPDLHQRAIRWYEENDLIPKAVEHAFRARDYAKAASLVSQISEELWGRGEHATLLEWIAALPEAEKRQYPHLWVWQVSMLITAGKMQEAERCIPEIESYLRSFTGTEPEHASVMGRVFSLRTYIASFYGDVPNLLRYAHLALENLPSVEDAGGRCGISLVLSNAYLNSGDLQAAGQALSEAIGAGKIAQRPYMVLTAQSNLATVLYAQGDLKRAGQVCQEGDLLVQQYELEHSPLAANLFVAQGLVLCEQHALDEAEACIRRGLEMARERGYIWSIAWGYRGLARLLLARGDLISAEAVLRESEQLASIHEIPAYHTCGISGLKARVWIGLGKIEAAEIYLQSRGIRADGEVQYPHESEYLALARLYLVKRDLERATKLLARMLAWADSAKQQLWVIRVLVLQALLDQVQGDRPQSLQRVDRALRLAEPQGILQVFVDEGEPMQDLLMQVLLKQGPLMQAVQTDIDPDYSQGLLEAFPGSRQEPSPVVAFQTTTHMRIVPERMAAASQPYRTESEALVEPLSKREMEIIRLIVEGYSNKEIAQKLYISLRTVKYHTTSIYSKLGVSGRTQAAFRARELGLL